MRPCFIRGSLVSYALASSISLPPGDTTGGVDIDSVGLEHLHGLATLRFLTIDLERNEETDDAVRALREALPDCQVNWRAPVP